MNEDMIKNMVENMQGGFTFGELYSAIYDTPQPKFGEPDKWEGPGYYRIVDAYDGISTLQYCETEEDIQDVFCEISYFAYVSGEVPDVYMDLANKSWDGAGYYIVDRLREMAWENDTQVCGYANDVDCLADGLFRTFDLREIIRIRKSGEDEEIDCSFFECPETLHGKTDPY